MNTPTDLNTQVEANLRAIWKGGSVLQPTWTAEQVQARAMQFEARARKLAFGDRVGFLLLPIVIVAALIVRDLRTLIHQPSGRIVVAGAVLLILCSVVGFLALRRHSYAAVTTNANDLFASHLERLSRLRDWYVSTPMGAALYLPGTALVLIGSGMNPVGASRELSIICGGLAAFAYVLACIQTRLKAQALQREIDSLAALRREPR